MRSSISKERWKKRAAGSAAVALLLAGALASEVPRLTALAPPPDWSRLKPYQSSISRARFVQLVDRLYAPFGGFWDYAQLEDSRVVLYADTQRTRERFVLEFKPIRPRGGVQSPKPSVVKAPAASPQKPLIGLRICLDPGHIGGAWAKMEERWFQLNGQTPVEEAALALQTCRHIASGLEALGAQVVWTKEQLEPVTQTRPADLRAQAIQELRESGVVKSLVLPQPLPQLLGTLLQKTQERLFYRNAEIRARAEVVAKLKPDLTLCVHYNADEWGDPNSPDLVNNNRLVVFVHGAYSASELSFEDERFEMVRKLLEQNAALELVAAESVAQALVRTFHLPPEPYRHSTSVLRVGESGYVFARNLLANRLFPGPVVYVEGPYMNSRATYRHLQLGDYEGVRKVNGRLQPSVYRQYANAVVEGVLEYAQHFIPHGR